MTTEQLHKYRISLPEDRIAQITNDIAEGIHKATKAELEQCVKYWAMEHHHLAVEVPQLRTKGVIERARNIWGC